MRIVWVGIGGAVGSVSRYLLAGLVQHDSVSFPLGTLVVNALGCFAMGFLAERWMTGAVDSEYRLAILVGVLGGFTTFSTFSWETLRLAQDRQFGYLALNALGSVATCLAAVWVGHRLAKWMSLS